jgi:hypothetical protein
MTGEVYSSAHTKPLSKDNEMCFNVWVTLRKVRLIHGKRLFLSRKKTRREALEQRLP